MSLLGDARPKLRLVENMGNCQSAAGKTIHWQADQATSLPSNLARFVGEAACQ